MIKEEESLKSRLLGSIESCRAEMEKLYLELQLPGFEVPAALHGGHRSVDGGRAARS